MVKVAVVGGGIIGLGSAYCLKQKYPDLHVTLISEEFSPETTGDGAAGLWTPYLVGDTNPELIKKWSLATLDFLLKIWKTAEGGELGLSLIPISLAISSDFTPPFGVYGLHEMSPHELRRLKIPSLRKGYSYTTFTCEPKKMLPYFLQEFTRAGGMVVSRRVTDLKTVTEEFDIVVQCCGLGARELVPDPSVYPIRGQVHRVKAPHIFHSLVNLDPDGSYIIPNQDTIILGGTHQEHDWNRSVSQEDKDFIISGCQRMIPSLKDSVEEQGWVGLRPGRPEVRLELEKVLRTNGKHSMIIHNYGHGGAGITLFWGCALDVAELVQQCVREINSLHVTAKSKL